MIQDEDLGEDLSVLYDMAIQKWRQVAQRGHWQKLNLSFSVPALCMMPAGAAPYLRSLRHVRAIDREASAAPLPAFALG